MQELINQIGSVIVTLIDNPVGGWISGALITAAAVGWSFTGKPPTDGPQPLPQ